MKISKELYNTLKEMGRVVFKYKNIVICKDISFIKPKDLLVSFLGGIALIIITPIELIMMIYGYAPKVLKIDETIDVKKAEKKLEANEKMMELFSSIKEKYTWINSW